MSKRKALIFALLFAAVAGICATDTGYPHRLWKSRKIL